MMRRKLQLAIAVICGVVLALGIVCCFYVDDAGMPNLVAILGLLYVVYLVKFFQYRKKHPTEEESALLKRKK